jgi:hypothetical protein
VAMVPSSFPSGVVLNFLFLKLKISLIVQYIIVNYVIQ